MKCLDNIVGVANTDCACYTNGLDSDVIAEMKLSHSKLYLDKLEGCIPIREAQQPNECKKYAQAALDAICEASKRWRDDMIQGLGVRYKQSKKNFYGNIGSLSASTTYSPNGRYTGQRIRPWEYTQATITLRKIKLMVNGSATFNVYVRRAIANQFEMEPETIFTGSITTVANTWATCITKVNDEYLSLPLMVDGIPREYYIFYDRTEAPGISPLNNEIFCNCPNDPTHAVKEYAQVLGVDFSDFDNLASYSSNNSGHGFSLDTSISCNQDDILCRALVTDNAFYIATANAILFKAAQLLIEKIFTTNEVNRFNLSNRDQYAINKSIFEQKYNVRVQFCIDNIDLSETNCYKCQDSKMYKAGIKN